MNTLTDIERRERFRAAVLARNPERDWTRHTLQGCDGSPLLAPIPCTTDHTRQTYATGDWLTDWTPTREPIATLARCVTPERVTRDWLTVTLAPRATLTRQSRWNIRACVDVIARERVERERLTEMMIAHTGTTRADRIRARAIASGQVVGYAPTREGAWDEWSWRGVTNARETRAAERGRGNVKRGPSAARVTTRDHYAPASSLRMLRTVGVATHAHASGAEYLSMLAEMLRGGHAGTYRAYAPGDTVGVVVDMTPDADTPDTPDTRATPDAPDTRADMDRRIAASLGTTDIGAMLDA